MNALKYLHPGSPVWLLVFLGLACDVRASSWICHEGELTREVVIFYPEAPARLPCKVFYAKRDENVVPRALWEAENTPDYCEQKAAEFIEKLSSSGWRCQATTSEDEAQQ